MKALVLLVSLIQLGFTHTGLAQAEKIFRMGLTAGFNNNFIPRLGLNEPYSHPTTLQRYNAGLALEQQLSDKLALSYNLLYSRQGGVIVVTSQLGDGNNQDVTELDYISLPIQLRYSPKPLRGFMLEAGAQAGYLLASQFYIVSDKYRSTIGTNVSHRWDVGLTAGLGYRLGKHIVVDSRYYWGLIAIWSKLPQAGEQYYNRTWASTFTYYF